MVDLGLIFKEQEFYVEKIIEDIRKNNFSWEILEYISKHYAQVAIEHNEISLWDKNSYEKYIAKCNEKEDFCEIRINYGYIYKYVNVHNIKELDRDWNDMEEEWETDRDCYEQFDGKEEEYILEYVELGGNANG